MPRTALVRPMGLDGQLDEDPLHFKGIDPLRGESFYIEIAAVMPMRPRVRERGEVPTRLSTSKAMR